MKISPPKEYHFSVHSSFICKSLKLETPGRSLIDELINKLWYIHTIEYSAIKRNGLRNKIAWLNPNNMLSEKKSKTKEYISYVFICMRFQKNAI